MAAFKKDVRLYIDESGVPEYLFNPNDRYYTVCGVIVNPIQAERLKTQADQIKFKYWGTTKIVFHSWHIGKRMDDFSILTNPQIEGEFIADLYKFLNRSGYKLIIVSVDKHLARRNGWRSKDILDKSFAKMLETYLIFLNTSGAHGQIIMESSGGKDVRFYKQYTNYLSHGLPSEGLSHIDVKKLMTAISFVSKNNHDIETQVADLFAYPAGCKCANDDNHNALVTDSYEDKICQVLPRKIANINGNQTFFRL